MTCDDVIERLPWRVKGALAPEVDARIDAHLAGCDRCRAALADTGFVLHAVETAHPPVEWIVAVALGEATDAQRAEVDAHIAGCGRCHDELVMTRASAATRPETERGSAASGRWRRRRPEAAGALPIARLVQPLLAAMLVLALGIAAIAGFGWRSSDRQVRAQAETVASLERQRSAAAARVDRLERYADALAREAATDLDPATLTPVAVRRLMGDGTDASVQVSGAGLLLSIQGSLRWPERVGVEIVDARDVLLHWQGEVTRGPDGPYEVPVPASHLARARGALEIRVVAHTPEGQETLGSYSLTVTNDDG